MNVISFIKKNRSLAQNNFVFILCAITLCSCTKSYNTFSVTDFGAIGDGINNDGPAIRKAVEAAVEAGSGSKVVFEKKTYRLDKTDNDCQITLKGATGLSIEGNGAEIINHPYNGIIYIDSCKDIRIGGFTFDCNPLPFTQGTITEVDPEKGVFSLKIHEGYENPVKAYRDMNKRPDWGWGVCIDPVERKRKPEASMHFFIKEVTELDASNNLMRVELTEDYRKYATEICIGDRFVITLKYGNHASNIGVNSSSDITLENNIIYTAKYSMTHRFTNNFGRVYAKNISITFKPGTDRLITTPKDGFHCKHNAIGPVIEDGLFEGMLDDAINISVCPYWVKEDLGDNRYFVAEVSHSPYPGDTLMAYTPESGLVTEHLKIVAVEAQHTPEDQQGAWNIITLDKPIPELRLHQGNNLFPGGYEKLKFTGLYNINRSGKDYIIRNNTFREQRRYGVLARASGGLIEGNSFIGVGGSGIYLSNEIGSFYEGPFPANTSIRNNTFINTFWSAIKVDTKGKNVWAHTITISGNFFSGWYTSPREKGPAAAIHLINVDGSVIRENIIESGKAEPELSFPVLIENSRNVELMENNISAKNKPVITLQNTENVQSDTD